MSLSPCVVVIIPAFNEENSVAQVIQAIPMNIVSEIVVVNNNSNDLTRTNALKAGALVLDEPRQGYGSACLKGIEFATTLNPPPDIIVFIDADFSDYPEEIASLISPIVQKGYDLVIGSRALGTRERGAMTPQQIIGNKIATTLLRFIYGVKYTDLGPFRAIRFEKLM
jgi:glycosyltransferase involved in cell wall biosynthesis